MTVEKQITHKTINAPPFYTDVIKIGSSLYARIPAEWRSEHAPELEEKMKVKIKVLGYRKEEEW